VAGSQRPETTAGWDVSNASQHVRQILRCSAVKSSVVELGIIDSNLFVQPVHTLQRLTNYLIMLRKVKFYRNPLRSCNTVLSDVFFMFLSNNFSNDCVLQTIFISKSDATRSVWCAFENYVVL